MLRRHRKHVANSQPVKFVSQILARHRVRFVHRQRHRFAQPQQHLRQVAIRPCDLAAPIHQKNDVRRVIERHLCLLEYFCGDVFRLVHHDPAGIDHLKLPPVIPRLSVNPVPRDPRLVAHNGAPRLRDPVEQRGFSNVGTPHYDDGGRNLRHSLYRSIVFGTRAEESNFLHLLVVSAAAPAG